MKNYKFLMMAALSVSFLMVSCGDDDSSDASSGNSQGETSRPGVRVEGKVTLGGRTYTRTVGGTVGNAVDLGLPSGTLWADHNIGASKPEEYGAYLAWAEVGAEEEGYTNGIKRNYALSTTKYYNGDNSWNKYVTDSFYGTVDNKIVLESIDDAAIVNWGDDWRMPTCGEQTELLTKCTWTWITADVKDANGNFITGYRVVGPNGNSIFLPASGHRYESSPSGVGSLGYYWSGSLDTGWSCYLYFGSNSYEWGNGRDRSGGFSVRPVRAQN